MLLVVREGTDEWRHSIVHPPTYEVSPPFNELALLAPGAADGVSQRAWREELNRAVDAVAAAVASRALARARGPRGARAGATGGRRGTGGA